MVANTINKFALLKEINIYVLSDSTFVLVFDEEPIRTFPKPNLSSHNVTIHATERCDRKLMIIIKEGNKLIRRYLQINSLTLFHIYVLLPSHNR